MKTDGVDSRTGLAFTHRHRSLDRLSIGRVTPRENMRTEFIVPDPQSMADMQEGIKTIVAESWFVNMAQGAASAEEVSEAFRIILKDYAAKYPNESQFDVEAINNANDRFESE
jgi:hypothetical protein